MNLMLKTKKERLSKRILNSEERTITTIQIFKGRALRKKLCFFI